MEGVTDDKVKRRHIRHCYKADPEYGKGVAKALGIDINSIDLETEMMKHTKTLKINLICSFYIA